MDEMNGFKTYTVIEVAAILKCNKRTIHLLLKNKELQGFRIHAKWRITKQALENFMAKQ